MSRNIDGLLAVYLVSGFQIIGAQVVGGIGTDWTVVGVADFNGDNRADFITRKADGTLAMYLMNGFQILGAQVIGAEGASFVRGREDSFQEIPYEGVIVSLVHRGNLSTRKRPMGHEPNGWHFGALLDQEFTLITNIENPEFKHPGWLRAFVLKSYLVE